MTNESKVEVIFGHDCNVSTAYTTHADYRALKERYEALKVTEREGYAEYHRTRVELASIKARVGGIEKKDPDLCDREYANGWNACRLALEASK